MARRPIPWTWFAIGLAAGAAAIALLEIGRRLR